jgi:septin family protein
MVPEPFTRLMGRGKKRLTGSNYHICLHAGFGDAINCEESWRACCSYIDEQFRQYFTDESGLNRKNIQDNRVHCCLYFVPPYGHGYVDICQVVKQTNTDMCRIFKHRITHVSECS